MALTLNITATAAMFEKVPLFSSLNNLAQQPLEGIEPSKAVGDAISRFTSGNTGNPNNVPYRGPPVKDVLRSGKRKSPPAETNNRLKTLFSVHSSRTNNSVNRALGTVGASTPVGAAGASNAVAAAANPVLSQRVAADAVNEAENVNEADTLKEDYIEDCDYDGDGGGEEIPSPRYFFYYPHH